MPKASRLISLFYRQRPRLNTQSYGIAGRRERSIRLNDELRQRARTLIAHEQKLSVRIRDNEGWIAASCRRVSGESGKRAGISVNTVLRNFGRAEVCDVEERARQICRGRHRRG